MMDKNVLKNISYGVYVVGTKDDRNVGCIANSIMQVTSSPITIIVSLNHDNYTTEKISKVGKFSISILKENIDPKIIGTFGYQTSKDINKYENVAYDEIDNLPVLKDTCGILLCKVLEKYETNSHTLFLATVEKMLSYEEEKPLTYRYYHEVLKGKSPKNAPTYIEEEKKKTVWKCKICGYEVEAESLDEDFICPICGRPASDFEKIEK